MAVVILKMGVTSSTLIISEQGESLHQKHEIVRLLLLLYVLAKRKLPKTRWCTSYGYQEMCLPDDSGNG